MDIYQKYEALSPVYQGGLTNHLPMVLIALKELGVPNDLIIKKLDNYRDEKWIFDLTNSNTPIDNFNQEYINRTSYNLGVLNQQGEDILIGEFINKNKFNISSALFHGLIRLAYAKQVHHPLMIAQALAYFEICVETVEFKATYIDVDEFEQSYRRLFNSFKDLNYTFESNNTMGKLKELLEHNLIGENLFYLINPSQEFILNFILTNFKRTNDFYILHLITGFEALIELEEYILDFDEVLNHFFVLAQVIVLFNTSVIIEKSLVTKSIDDLIEEVGNLTDFHKIKLFYSLVKLERLYKNEKINLIANQLFIE